jgi:hypothetical protein
MPHYVVLKGTGPSDISDKVNKYLADGYILHGSLQITMGNNPDYVQAVVKYA